MAVATADFATEIDTLRGPGMASTPVSWVVYRMILHGKATGMNAVCEQAEWEAMERDRPGYHTLLQAGIASENEADRIARAAPRGDAGDRG
jgi:hypothetical protein